MGKSALNRVLKRLHLADRVGGPEHHLQRAEFLKRLVVKLTSPSAPLGLRGTDGVREAICLDRLGGGDRYRRAGAERGQQVLLIRRECRRVPFAVERYEDASRTAAEVKRHDQRGCRSGADPLETVAHPVGEARHSLRFATRHDGARKRALGRKRHPHCPGPDLARRGRHAELARVVEQNQQRAGFHERAATLHDQLEHALEIGFEPDGTRDRRSRLEASYDAFEILSSPGNVLVQARVADRDCGPLGEDDGRLFVALVELGAVLLVGQVKVPVDLAADHDRHPEEGRHRRVARGEAVRARMLCDIGEAQWPGVTDQLSEDASPPGKRTDHAAGFVVDAEEHEAFELLLVLVENPESRVARTGELARGLEDAAQHDLHVQLGHERASDLEELGVIAVAQLDAGGRTMRLGLAIHGAVRV